MGYKQFQFGLIVNIHKHEAVYVLSLSPISASFFAPVSEFALLDPNEVLQANAVLSELLTPRKTYLSMNS